jgi:asparagine synthase (glutamine-hydrolysing)
MCGLYTEITRTNEFNISSIKVLKKKLDLISHRGPDNSGYWSDYKKIFLGHQRLSIVDNDKKSNQPFTSNDKRYKIIYNGEIYNYLELKSVLLKKGLKFRTKSDTEVVLNSFIYWKHRCLDFFDGMFSFIIWDNQEKKLFIARDKVGIKPLYYTTLYDKILFCSELKPILKNFSGLSINEESLIEYFTFQNYLDNKTIFKNIYLFPAGSYIYLNAKKKIPNDISPYIKRYWRYNLNKKIDIDEADALNFLNDRLKDSVKKQGQFRGELASYQSSGTDSSLINYYLKNNNFDNLHLVSIGFNNKDFSKNNNFFYPKSEVSDARNIATKLNFRFRSQNINHNHLKLSLPRISYILDEPRVGQSYPNYYAAKNANKFSKVVLSGTGADELFGGYTWRYIENKKKNTFEDFYKKYSKIYQKLISLKDYSECFNLADKNNKNYVEQNFKRNLLKHYNNNDSYLNTCLDFEFNTFLSSLLIVEDKLSMNFSLENRVPYLCNDLIKFSETLPNKFKIYNGKGKYILHKLLNKNNFYFDCFNKKQGFSAPDSYWFKKQLKPFLLENFCKNNAMVHNFISKKFIQKKLKLHFDNKKDSRLFIWSLLTFNSLLNRYFDK